MNDHDLSHLPLGRIQSFSPQYDPGQLCPVPRSLGREGLGFNAQALPFFGEDIWNCWELSWLDQSGKPHIAVAELRVAADSPFLVESKSLKLYLNSFNMTPMDSAEALRDCIAKDVSAVCGTQVQVCLWMPENFGVLAPAAPLGSCLDTLPFDRNMPPAPCLLQGDERRSEALFSRLLRSRCPVTDQPDWATVQIRYTGRAICPESLLRYIVGLREHSGFHESCVETLFSRILKSCHPEKLLVSARFTRRGGIDINPWRSTHREEMPNFRDFRQ